MNVEPRSKNAMPDGDKISFQAQILESLRKHKRTAFRGPIALQIAAHTTERNPSHAQTIAKNLVDLLGRPLAAASSRNGLLYFDDSQVNALSVACRHGESQPRITITAMRMADFLDDLSLATNTAMNDRGERSTRSDGDSVAEFRKDLRNAERDRAIFGDRGAATLLKIAQRNAQESLLAKSGVSIPQLGWMYGAHQRHRILSELERTFERNSAWDIDLRSSVEKMFHMSPLRVRLSELPQHEGASETYKREVETAITNFRRDYEWILDPLMVPVAMEVVIKPPPVQRAGVYHDLDNVLRTYLLPRVLEVLKPPSDIHWTLEADTVKPTDSPIFAEWSARAARLPKSARIGLTRYEAWRLPRLPGDDSPGFVSLSIVADMLGHEDLLRRIDRLIERFEEQED